MVLITASRLNFVLPRIVGRIAYCITRQISNAGKRRSHSWRCAGSENLLNGERPAAWRETHLLWRASRMEVRLEDLFCKGLEIYTQSLLDRCNRSHALDPSAFLGLRMGLRFSTYLVDQLNRVNRLIESHKSHCSASAHSGPKNPLSPSL